MEPNITNPYKVKTHQRPESIREFVRKSVPHFDGFITMCWMELRKVCRDENFA